MAPSSVVLASTLQTTVVLGNSIRSYLSINRPKVGLKRIVRVNGQNLKHLFLYLTMEDTDNNFYEAKVYMDFGGHFNLDMIRPAVHYLYIDPEILRRFDAPD
ncbi:hypothetical protein PanWU01x14_315910 [Parasponia andersonii]|uniref:Uncharacterized protein n=1 Tax=Parasponia andersonii TaxID=3476 RepID=A0A2P5AN48_PARAD|nr:hypothetical protein PanWU01x14_315910 [Parasponia andersonii]